MPSHSRKYTKIPVLLWLQIDLRMLAIFVFQGFNDASTKFLPKDMPRQQFASLNCSCDTVFSLVSMNLKYSILSLLSYTHQNISKLEICIYYISNYVYTRLYIDRPTEKSMP